LLENANLFRKETSLNTALSKHIFPMIVTN